MNDLTVQPGPDWVIAEMPPGYQTRVNEIRRLIADLGHMGRFARLLWQVGPELASAVADAFAALKFDAELTTAAGAPVVLVRLEPHQRLLLVPAATDAVIQKKSAELSHVFTLLQEVAEDGDRVVLVTNVESAKRPAERTAALTPDALALLVRLGAVHLSGSTLFELWKVSFEGLERARAQITRLHKEEAGTFTLPASMLRLAEMKL